MKQFTALIGYMIAAAGVACAQLPTEVNVNSWDPNAPGLTAYRANQQVYRVTFLSGTNAAAHTGKVPFMAWATNSTAGGVVTASYAVVSSASSNVVDFTFSSADLNATPGRYFYQSGLKTTGGVVTDFRTGFLTIKGSPLAAGASAITWATNVNLSLLTVTGNLNMRGYWVTNATYFGNGAGLTNVTAASYTETDPLAVLATGARAMSGNLNMGGYSVTNVATNSITYTDGSTGLRSTDIGTAVLAPTGDGSGLSGVVTAESDTLATVLGRGNNANGGSITNMQIWQGRPGVLNSIKDSAGRIVLQFQDTGRSAVATNGNPVFAWGSGNLEMAPGAIIDMNGGSITNLATNTVKFADGSTALRSSQIGTDILAPNGNGSGLSGVVTAEVDPGWAAVSNSITANSALWPAVSNTVTTGAALGATALQPSGDGSGLTNLNATQLLNGTVPLARISGLTRTEHATATDMAYLNNALIALDSVSYDITNAATAAGQTLQTSVGSETNLYWATPAAGAADNLGNHTATMNVNGAGFAATNVGHFAGTGTNRLTIAAAGVSHDGNRLAFASEITDSRTNTLATFGQRNIGQMIAQSATATNIVWTEEFDPNSLFAAGAYVTPAAGDYQGDLQCTVTNLPSNREWRLAWYRDGAWAFSASDIPPTDSSRRTLTCVAVFTNCTAGTVLEPRIYVSTIPGGIWGASLFPGAWGSVKQIR